MARVCSSGVFLIVLFELTEASIQRITHRENIQVMMRYSIPKNYPCMADWNKVCMQDSDCCSGTCLALFCKIKGVEAPTTLRPRRRGKLRAKGKDKGKGKGAPVNQFDKSGDQEAIRQKRIQ